MTDFVPATGFGALRAAADSSWMTPPVTEARRTAPAQRRIVPTATHSAASLAAAVHQLLEAVTGKRVPRLDQLRQRLQQADCGWDLRELERALHALQEQAGGIDFLAGRGGKGQAEEFRRQAGAVGAAARRLGSAAMNFVGRHAAQAAVSRLLWIDLVLESRALEKRGRKGLAWVVDMEHELQARRAGATAEVSRRALQELARRGQLLEDRLHLVLGLCGASRAARSLGEQATSQRDALARTLQDKVRPASLALQQRLQPLLDAAGTRPLEPAELLAAIEARHALQVALTHATAGLIQLKALQEELETQLAWLGQKAGQAGALPPPSAPQQ